VKGKSDSTREVGMLLKASNWGFRELAANRQSSSGVSGLSTVFSMFIWAFAAYATMNSCKET
jgi:hypothetical protein